MKLLTPRVAALLNRKLEHAHGDRERIRELVELNHRGMARLLAEVEAEQGAADRVVALDATEAPPALNVYSRSDMLEHLERNGRTLELEEMAKPTPAGMFKVLAGTDHVLEVWTLPRNAAVTS